MLVDVLCVPNVVSSQISIYAISMFSTAAITIALAIAPALAIPPPEFGFVDSGNHTELSVAYTSNGNTTVVQEGQLFGGSGRF